jgi:hypothetical protein
LSHIQLRGGKVTRPPASDQGLLPLELVDVQIDAVGGELAEPGVQTLARTVVPTRACFVEAIRIAKRVKERDAEPPGRGDPRPKEEHSQLLNWRIGSGAASGSGCRSLVRSRFRAAPSGAR